MTITGQASAHVSAYFNKGIVSAQWVSRALATVGKNAKLNDLIAQPGNSLRNALSGLLRPQLLNLLDDVKNNGGEIYAALYELNDPELIPRLVALGQKCHLILANGAFKPPTNDENNACGRSCAARWTCTIAWSPKAILRITSSSSSAIPPASRSAFCPAAPTGQKPDFALKPITASSWTTRTWGPSSSRNGICSSTPGMLTPHPLCKRTRR